MDDTALATFTSITGTTPDRAAQYLGLTEGDVQQAIEFFYANDGAELEGPNPSAPTHTSQAPPVPPSQTRPPGDRQAYEDDDGVVHIDSDVDSDIDVEPSSQEPRQAIVTGSSSLNAHTTSNSISPSNHDSRDVDADEALARRLQEEFYGGAGMAGGLGEDGIRAPMARTTETLIGPESFDPNNAEEMHAAVLEQMRARHRPRPRGTFYNSTFDFLSARLTTEAERHGIFNQATAGSIWNDADSSADAHRDRLARATAGASEASSKQTLLAEMYRPPFEIMSRLSWDQARQEGKDKEKWILVNIQDPAIFDCQILNRDIWKNSGVMDTVRENFIFMQYTKDDPRGSQYIQYSFLNRDSQDAYPHIAIVDPRTGEQVKVWSGAPIPKAMDFLMQLHEFLDRYSLKATAKNPVARRKPETKKETRVEQMTEEQMLEMALQNSLAGNGTLREDDPDDLTRSVGGVHNGKGKGKEVEEDTDMLDEFEPTHTNGSSTSPSPFNLISSSNPHTEPPPDAASTRIQFRHPNGRIIRRFVISDPVRRMYEWLKASPLEGKGGMEFELIYMGKNLKDSLGETIEHAGLKNGTINVEFIEG